MNRQDRLVLHPGNAVGLGIVRPAIALSADGWELGVTAPDLAVAVPARVDFDAVVTTVQSNQVGCIAITLPADTQEMACSALRQAYREDIRAAFTEAMRRFYRMAWRDSAPSLERLGLELARAYAALLKEITTRFHSAAAASRSGEPGGGR